MTIGQQFKPHREYAVRTEKTIESDEVTTFVCTDRAYRDIVKDVRVCLEDGDRKPEYRGHDNPIAGHCYVASEILYKKLGGKKAGWTPQTIRHEGGTHWYLKNQNGTIIDPTADQFETAVPYAKGRGCGFMTTEPSARAQRVMERLDLLA